LAAGGFKRIRKDLLTSGIPGDFSSPFLRRVRFTNVFGYTTTFALLVFAGLNLSRGNILAVMVETAAALFGVFILVFLRKTSNLDRAQTLLLADITAIMIFLYATGGIAMTGIFWWFTYPVAAFFITGRKKGWYWIAGIMIFGALLKAFGETIGISVPFSYPVLRQFGASFLVVSLVLHLYEATRDDYEKAIEESMRNLEKAAASIRTLKGLVPICSSCKKIRDDKGFWQQLEVYVSEHTEADFSHGMCDECAARLLKKHEEEQHTGETSLNRLRTDRDTGKRGAP
jgi:hypothetical protein